MKLYATPLSHFSRKVRILLDQYAVPYELIDPGNVARSDAEAFGGNPLLRVPALLDGERFLIDSDHIAKYVVEKYDPADRYRVNRASWDELNLRAMLNGIMNEEVKLIIARRTGLPTEDFPFFDKARKAIDNGLNWLEANASKFDLRSPGYAEFHLVCIWEHLKHYGMLEPRFPELEKCVQSILADPVVKRSSPAAIAVASGR